MGGECGKVIYTELTVCMYVACIMCMDIMFHPIIAFHLCIAVIDFRLSGHCLYKLYCVRSRIASVPEVYINAYKFICSTYARQMTFDLWCTPLFPALLPVVRLLVISTSIHQHTRKFIYYTAFVPRP